jgi:DNA (cytosine-5)-methyltransferase 1
MNYLSVCSGVEAATVAWHSLGWKPVGFSEIEKFPSAVLQHHYPQVTNYGDMTTYKEWDINESVGLLVGGTPCQSFSVAGLRKGLEDPRGNLALTYVGILDRFRPKWFIWENVPGVLSSNSGRDFGSFLGAVAECGYGFAYRVLDAQYFGVPQRRRRVFVVGCLGDWESAAKVLFEPDCLRGDTPPSREKGKETPGVTTNRLVAFGEYSDDGVASTIKARDCKGHTDLIVYETHPADSRVKAMGDVCQTVTSRWGTGGGNVPLVQNVGCDVYNHAVTGETAATLTMNSGGTNTAGPKVIQVQSIGFTQCDAARDVGMDVSPTLRSGGNGGYPSHSVAYGFEPGITKREGNPNRFTEELSPTLRAQMGDNQAAVAYSIREDAKANNFSATPLHVTPALQALRPSVQSHHAQTFIVDRAAFNQGENAQYEPRIEESDIMSTLVARGPHAVAQSFNVNARPDEMKLETEISGTLTSSQNAGLFQDMAVRRLTPVECERLQGFPDNYTQIPWGKGDTPDSHRYKAMGNSMAVPCMQWIGDRIQKVENGLL